MQRTLSSDEIARRGNEIYRSRVLPSLTPEDHGKLVLIDVDTSDYELGTDELALAAGLKRRRPDAQVWFRRVGTGPVRRYGRRAAR